jgi:membrane protease YdiL (CAAX protease family)
MNSFPEYGPDQEPASPEVSETLTEAHDSGAGPVDPVQAETSWPQLQEPSAALDVAPPSAEPLLFQSWSEPEVVPPVRIPHFGHLALLVPLSGIGLLLTGILFRTAIYFHLFGITTLNSALTDIRYMLSSEAILYLFIFVACLIVFPQVWHKGFFAGLQWNGAAALHHYRYLLGMAVLCFLLALFSGMLMPGPNNAPIDKIFRAPGAAWLLFAFGVTFAPFFEEIAFRGFLLPALCTAWDWAIERSIGKPVPPLGINDHPQWSNFAMLFGVVLTSVPFALMHATQTGYAVGPFFLLVGVSMVLCWIRLKTRSLASSVLVHASYNFLLFSIMMFGTSGFRHLDKF